MAKTTKVGLAGADRFDKQAEAYKKATTCESIATYSDRLGQLACRNADGFSNANTGNIPPILVRHRLVLC